MPEPFDPYLTWLNISPEDRPVNHYRLLGVPLMEEHPAVIEEAADRVIQTLRSLDVGAHTFEQRMLLNKVSAARHCLLNEVLREKYNQKLAQADAATPKSPASGRTERESQDSDTIETAPIEKGPRDAEPWQEKAAPVPPSPPAEPAAQSPVVAPQEPQAPAAASAPQSPSGPIAEVEKPRTTLARKKRPGHVTRILQFLRLKQK